MRYLFLFCVLFTQQAYANSNISEKRFYEIVESLESQYKDTNLIFEADWFNRKPSAYIFSYENTSYFVINGGLAHLYLNEEDFIFQLCYKIESYKQDLEDFPEALNLRPVLECEAKVLNNNKKYIMWYEEFRQDIAERISYAQGCKQRWTETWDKQFVQLLKSAGPYLMATVTKIPKDSKAFCPSGKQKIHNSNSSKDKNKKAMGLLLEIFRSMASAESNCRPNVTANGATGTAVGLFQMGAHDARNHRCKTLSGGSVTKISQLKDAYTNMRCAITIANNVAKQSKHKNYLAAGSKGHIGVLGAFWAVVRTKGHGSKPRKMITSRSANMCKASSLASYYGNSVANKIEGLSY